MKQLFFTCLATILFAGCSSDDDTVPVAEVTPQPERGTEAFLRDFAGSDAYDAVVAMGLEVHFGQTPPQITGGYKSSPTKLTATTVPGDFSLGSDAGQNYFLFANQTAPGLTCDYNNKQHFTFSGANWTEQSQDYFAVISGSGEYFTVFAMADGMVETEDALALHVYSGRKTADGIEDLQFAVYMKANHGHDAHFIPNHTGRLYTDLMAENFN
ncbi:MAG TPA: hypothetical protein VK528_05045 [Flavobacterium sp.]|nr:hypothetical protein [Flavobacterium sp.]